MSDERKSGIDWIAAAPALAVLAAVSPPAAGAACAVLGAHAIYDWLYPEDGATGLDEV